MRALAVTTVVVIAACSGIRVPEGWRKHASWDAATPPTIRLLYATNRALVGTVNEDGIRALSRERSLATTYGSAAIDVALSGTRRRARARVQRVRSLGGSKRFKNCLRSRIAPGSGRVLLYVHGFNNGFKKAAERAALLTYFSGRRAVPVFFSWPSQACVLSYLEDRATADFSVPALKRLIVHIATTRGVQGIQIVGHSTGAWMVARALLELRLEGWEKLGIDDVVLAGADIDRDVLVTRFLQPGGHALADRVTLYVARGDWVLWISRFLHGHVDRAGHMRWNRTRGRHKAVSEIDVIDVSDVPGSSNHSGFLTHPLISTDLGLALRRDRKSEVHRTAYLEEMFAEHVRYRRMRRNTADLIPEVKPPDQQGDPECQRATQPPAPR